jgi:hypothetical protein
MLAAKRRKSMVYPRVWSDRLFFGDLGICDSLNELPSTSLRVGILPHGPELPHAKRNTCESNALVRNEWRAAGKKKNRPAGHDQRGQSHEAQHSPQERFEAVNGLGSSEPSRLAQLLSVNRGRYWFGSAHLLNTGVTY